jgi:hypothetical protein
MTTYPLLRFLILVFAAASTSVATYDVRADDLLDASNLRQALSMAAVRVSHMDEIRARCSSLVPASSREIHIYSLKWRTQNESELKAVLNFTKNAPQSLLETRDASSKSIMAAVEQLPTPKQIRYCMAYFDSIRKGERDFARTTPKLSKFLTEYIRESPLSASDEDRLNYEAGCAKQIANRAIAADADFNLDFTDATCKCLWDTTQRNTTAEERKLEDDTVREGKPLSTLPHWLRLQPLLAKCNPATQAAKRNRAPAKR